MAVVQSGGALTSAHRPWSWAGAPSSTSLTLYNQLVVDYATIYATQPNVRTVISFIARNIADLALKPYQRLSDTERESLGDHEVGAVCRQPNFRTTAYRFFNDLMHDLGIFGRFYAIKVRNPQSGRLNLLRVPPQMMRPTGDDWMFPQRFELLGSVRSLFFDAEQVFYLSEYDPRNSWGGLSPIESLRQILAEDMAAGRYREQFWNGSSRVSSVILRDRGVPAFSPEARERFLSEWDSMFSGEGSRAGRTPLLEEGMQLVPVAFSAKDSEYLGARRLSREEVAAAYHVSPLFVGILENANFSNVKEQHKHLYQDTLGPWCTMIEQDFQLQVMTEFSDLTKAYVEFNIAEKLKGSFEEEALVMQAAVGAPWMLRDEARARVNLPPVQGGDQLVVPLNVLVGGQASPRDSSPPVTASRKQALSKSLEELSEDLQGWAAKHLEILTEFFRRQGASVTSKLGAGQPLSDAWDTARWNEELGTDLSAASLSMANEIASQIASDLGGEFDPALAEAWLLNNARIAAEKINDTTYGQIDQSEDSAVVAAQNVFEVAASSRAAQIAITRATMVGNFSKYEGAQQSGARMKRWKVRSSQSRHPGLNNETVPIGETFSNGARYPGDPTLPEDEAAGCTCDMDFVLEEG